ncbi:hypothetical protein DSECCO2_614070 [anaerobic digester metagenome]
MKSSLFLAFIFAALFVNAQTTYDYWVNTIGGSRGDAVYDIETDNDGNVLITGKFQDTVDFDPSTGVFNLMANGTGDEIFVAKYDSNGAFIWAKAFGGSNYDTGYDLIVTDDNDVLIVGTFMLTVDFDPGLAVANLTSKGNVDIFILKLNENGDFEFVRQVGGMGIDVGSKMILDQNGNILITGYFAYVADFDPGSGVLSLVPDGPDPFLLKLDSLGNFIWVKHFTGPDTDKGIDIAVDAQNNIYFAGEFADSIDLDPGAGTVIAVGPNLVASTFVEKLNENGDMIWAKSFLSDGWVYLSGVALQANGNVILTGKFTDTVDFDPGVMEYRLRGDNYTYVCNLDSDGNFNWVKSFTQSMNYSTDVDVDENDYIYLSGSFMSHINFCPDSAMCLHYGGGTFSSYMAKLNPAGSFQYAVIFSGSDNNVGFGVNVDDDLNIYVCGRFNETVDFDPGAGVNNVLTNGFDDGYFIKYNCNDTSVYVSVPNAGLDEIFTEKKFNIFPNPASGNITVSVSGANDDVYVLIRDESGNLVERIDIDSNAQNVIEASWSSGVYFLEFFEGDNLVAIKTQIIN